MSMNTEDRERLSELLEEALGITDKYEYEETSHGGDPGTDARDRVDRKPGDMESYLYDAQAILVNIPTIRDDKCEDLKDKIVEILQDKYSQGCETNSAIRDRLCKSFGI